MGDFATEKTGDFWAHFVPLHNPSPPGLRLGVTPEKVSMLRRSFRSERLLLVRRTGAKVVVKQSGPGTEIIFPV